MTSIGTIYADRSHINIAGRDQTIFQSFNHSFPSSAADPHPVFNAPVDILSIHFTGRGNELDFLRTALSGTHNGVPSRCAVYGMPGIGKTQLLLRYAKLSWDLYSCIVWISATSVDRITQGISGILDLISHPDRYIQDQTAKLTTARLWLENYKDGRWLLIFDNVQRETLSFLRVHLPLMNERGNILFSTRTADVAESLAGEQHRIRELQAMDLRDTANLLFADAGIETEMATSLFSQAEDLVKQVGCLPLAVVQAASFMKQTHTTLDHMLELYKSERKIEMIRWENDLSLYEERSVARTILNQFHELNRQSRNILKLLSFLDPENIPVKLIVDVANAHIQPRPGNVPSPLKRIILRIFKKLRARERSHTKSNADVSTTLHTFPEFDSLVALILSPIEFQTAIQKLQNLSLVEQRDHQGTSSLWIHELIQFVVREHAMKDETYQSWLQSSWSLVYGAFLLIEDHTLPQWWTDCELLVPHLRSLRDAWSNIGGTNLEVTRANGEIAKYFESRGRYEEAEALSKQVLEETEKNLGNDHPDTLRSVNGLANVYYSQRRYDEAEALHKRALEWRAKRLGNKHPDTLKSVNNLALVYSSQGRYGEAEELHNRALARMEKRLGNDHPDTLKLVNNLAGVYRSQGRLDEAEALHKRTLERREKHLGHDHPDTLKSVSNVASVYSSQGRHDEAEELHKRALDWMEKCLGNDHPDTLKSVKNLASAYSSQGRYDEADALQKRTLEATEMGFSNSDHMLNCEIASIPYSIPYYPQVMLPFWKDEMQLLY